MALRLRRGTNAERQTVTFADGELVYVTDHVAEGVSPVWVGDGTTAGGRPVDTSNDPGATELGDLSDVVIGEDSSAPTDGQVLAWDSTNSYWAPQDAATPDLSSTVIGDLFDVVIDTPTEGQILTWNDTNGFWYAADTTALNQLSEDTAPALGGDLLANQNSIFNADTITADTIIGDFTGTLRGDIFADDSSVMYDSISDTINATEINAITLRGDLEGNVTGDLAGTLTGEVTGDVIGDIKNSDGTIILNHGSDLTIAQFTGNVTGNVAGDVTGDVTGNLQGSVIGENSALIINGVDNTITTESLTTDTISVSNTRLEVGRPTGITDFRLESYQTRNRLNINTVDKTGDLSGYTGYYGTLNFGYQDSTTDRSDATIRGAASDMRLAHDTVTDFISDETKYFTLKEGNFGFGTYTPAAKLDVRGEVMFGSFTTTERDALTPSNGTVIYNSTTDKFQGYAGGAWIDLH